MVIKYFGPNDKTGVVMPPYTAADRRYTASLRKWPTGTIVTVAQTQPLPPIVGRPRSPAAKKGG